MVSGNFLYTKESKEEIDKYLKSAKAYLNDSGGLQASPVVEVVERTLFNMTGD